MKKIMFHKGDWVVVSTTKGDRVVQIASVEYFKDGHPSYFTTEGRWFGNGTKARLLTDKDVETITIPENKVIIKQKPAEWSEDDESKRNALISLVEEIKNQPLKRLEDWDGYISWLKSIPQKQWKPSDEQLEALESATENCAYSEYQDCLRELIGRLRKLREE